MQSIEEKVEDHYKKLLDSYNIRHYGKTERARTKKLAEKALADAEKPVWAEG